HDVTRIERARIFSRPVSLSRVEAERLGEDSARAEPDVTKTRRARRVVSGMEQRAPDAEPASLFLDEQLRDPRDAGVAVLEEADDADDSAVDDGDEIVRALLRSERGDVGIAALGLERQI